MLVSIRGRGMGAEAVVMMVIMGFRALSFLKLKQGNSFRRRGPDIDIDVTMSQA